MTLTERMFEGKYVRYGYGRIQPISASAPPICMTLWFLLLRRALAPGFLEPYPANAVY